MASVTIKRGTEAEVASTAITDGQILFTTDREYNNQIMADVGENRILIGGNNVFTGTQAEYEEALSQGLIFEGMQVNITDDYDRDLESQNIPYDNTDSGLTATNVKDAIDEVQSEIDDIQSEVGNSYAPTDTSDTTIASADKIPFYDESATAKKNITLSNLVDTIAPNFGSQVSISQGNVLDLLDKDGNLLDSVTIETTANNVGYTDTHNIGETDIQGALDKTIEDVASQGVASGVNYTDTNSIGANNVQSALDTVGTLLKGRCKFVNTIMRNGDTYSWTLNGNQLSLVLLMESATSYNVVAVSGIYSGVVIPLLQGSTSCGTVTQSMSGFAQTVTITASRTCIATIIRADDSVS